MCVNCSIAIVWRGSVGWRPSAVGPVVRRPLYARIPVSALATDLVIENPRRACRCPIPGVYYSATTVPIVHANNCLGSRIRLRRGFLKSVIECNLQIDAGWFDSGRTVYLGDVGLAALC
jgi:hypothetical protein